MSGPADPRDSNGGEESRLAEYLQAGPDAALVLDTDGRFLFANDAAIELFALDRDSYRGRRFGRPLATDRELDIDVVTGREAKVVSVRARETEWAGRPAIIATFRDVTAARSAGIALARSEARFRAAFESAPAGLAVCKPDGTITMANPALSRLTQRSRDELVGESISNLLRDDDAEHELGQRRRLLTGAADSFSSDVTIVSANGGRPGRLHGRLADAAAGPDEAGSAIVYQVTDLTERRAVERRLRYEAEHDDLTRLRSRGAFLEELARTVAECRRYKTTAGLLLIDVDRLKPINDRLGHAAGDRALRRISAEIANRVRSSDVVGRLGGDEFAIVLPRAEASDIETLATALVEMVEASEAETDVEEEARTTVSIGAIRIDADTLDADQALGEADAAMYEAKGDGGNRAVTRLNRPS